MYNIVYVRQSLNKFALKIHIFVIHRERKYDFKVCREKNKNQESDPIYVKIYLFQNWFFYFHIFIDFLNKSYLKF